MKERRARRELVTYNKGDTRNWRRRWRTKKENTKTTQTQSLRAPR
jgi:hypothetical protein